MMSRVLSSLLDFISSSRRNIVFLRNMITLASGNTAAFVISFFLTPIISRIFNPEDFGVVALFVAISMTVGNVMPLSYNRGAVVAGDDLQATLLVRLAFGIVVAMCIVLFLLISILHNIMPSFHFMSRLGNWIWLLPVAIFLIGLSSILESLLTREKAFKTLAYANVSQVSLVTCSRLSLGLAFGSSTWALLVGYAVGAFGRFVLLIRTTAPLLRKLPRQYSSRDLIKVAREYKDFPLYNTPTVFILGLSQNLPVLMLGFLFSPVVVGFYAMANRLVQIPMNTGMTAFRRVYIQKAAELRNDGRPLYGALAKTTAGLAFIGAIPFVLLWLFGESLLTIILGKHWAEAGRYVEVLSPWLYTTWVAAPSSLMMIVMRKQSMWLGIQLWILGLRLSAFIAAYALSATPEWTLNVFVIISMMCYVGIVANSFRLVCQVDKEALGKNITITG
jgi:lipopolysaccharide exporter